MDVEDSDVTDFLTESTVSYSVAVAIRTMQETSRSGTTESMLRSLVGDDCCWCTAGTLTRETFKGDDAVVCENCETPAVRVW